MKKLKKVYIDFEFNRVTSPTVNLVSAASHVPGEQPKKWWLHRDKKSQNILKEYLKGFDVVVGYSAVAEARSYFALGFNHIETLNFKWIDLFIEYRMITNSNDNLQWGKQLVDGKVKTVHKPRPKWERAEGETSAGFKATHSLAEATYKLLGEIRDTEHKKKMRDLIISDPDIFSEDEQEAILNYGVDDVVHLSRMEEKIFEHFCELVKNEKEYVEKYFEEACWRGNYSVHTAIMESVGYPVDVKKTKNFSAQVGNILHDCQTEINKLFPEIKPFRWNKKDQRFSLNQSSVVKWIESTPYAADWMKTEGGSLSLALDAFQRYYDFKHDYPLDSFGAQMVRYLKLKQSIYGFNSSPGSTRKNFWDSVGPDNRVRPYMNHYGAQSSRSQPGSSGFMFLKPAWMRALVRPAPGFAIAGIDWSSQEFLLSALESEDTEMIKAYLSGDVYLAFAKTAGMVPKNATKDSHKFERNLAKSTVLGISYLMTKFGLAIKLTQDTGKEFTEDDAQGLIDAFYETYPVFHSYQTETIPFIYSEAGFIKLNDGWYMFGDNDNFRSVFNVGIQGAGAAIMRKAVDMVVRQGVRVLFTLHDAIYIEYEVGQERQVEILNNCMRDATAWYYKNDSKEIQEYASMIRMDPFAWSDSYKKDSEMKVGDFKFPVSDIYLDERAQKDFLAFSKYFDDRAEDSL